MLAYILSFLLSICLIHFNFAIFPWIIFVIIKKIHILYLFRGGVLIYAVHCILKIFTWIYIYIIIYKHNIFFLNIYMYVFVFIYHNKYTHYTLIYYVNNFFLFWMRLIVWQHYQKLSSWLIWISVLPLSLIPPSVICSDVHVFTCSQYQSSSFFLCV